MDEKTELEAYKIRIRENMVTVAATAFIIGMVAIGTGSLNCFWGLLMLLFVNLKSRE